MKLMFRFLDDVANVNNFYEIDRLEISAGDADEIFFAIYQKNPSDTSGHIKRYIPAAGSTLSVTFDSIDDAIKITRSAVMAYPTDDRSIWKVSVMPTDKISGIVKMSLIENGTNKTLYAASRLVVASNERFC